MGTRTVKAWHFLREDYRLRYEDGRKIRPGSLTKVRCAPILCASGLHASRNILDAVSYAAGPILCRVRVGGEIVEGYDKLVGTERYVEWTLDATWLLHEFACRVAVRALRAADIQEQAAWDAVRVKRLWLLGMCSDADLQVACEAAEDFARQHTWPAPRTPKYDAAWSVAWASALLSAATCATRASANATKICERAAGAVEAFQRERATQERMLLRMIAKVPWA